jgi:hypothetical protein
MGLEIPKSIMIYVMSTFDISMAFLFLYGAVSLTRDFGFGNRRQILLLGHRLSLLLASAAFAWHVYDIWQDPARHGLTFSNFILHLSLVIVTMYASIRMLYAERPLYGAENGDLFLGPFWRHNKPQPPPISSC